MGFNASPHRGAQWSGGGSKNPVPSPCCRWRGQGAAPSGSPSTSPAAPASRGRGDGGRGDVAMVAGVPLSTHTEADKCGQEHCPETSLQPTSRFASPEPHIPHGRCSLQGPQLPSLMLSGGAGGCPWDPGLPSPPQLRRGAGAAAGSTGHGGIPPQLRVKNET